MTTFLTKIFKNLQKWPFFHHPCSTPVNFQVKFQKKITDCLKSQQKFDKKADYVIKKNEILVQFLKKSTIFFVLFLTHPCWKSQVFCTFFEKSTFFLKKVHFLGHFWAFFVRFLFLVNKNDCKKPIFLYFLGHSFDFLVQFF